MEHHGGLFADISNSFPGAGGLPSTNVKYHLHNPPQIPPQPPPPPVPPLGSSRQYHQYQQQQQQQHHHSQQPQHQQSLNVHLQNSTASAGQQTPAQSVVVGGYGQPATGGIIQQSHVMQPSQQQPELQSSATAATTQQRQHHLETLHQTLGGAGGLYTDTTTTTGLYNTGSTNTASALCVSNSPSAAGTGGGASTNASYTSSNVTNTSRKFETNTGDSITYNINNINTNIVNNISAGQGAPPAIAAITNGGGGTDFLGGVTAAAATQYGAGSSLAGTAGGQAQGVTSNPTIINISNNNHNIMAPPYPYPHGAQPQYAQPKSAHGGYKELAGKYGAVGTGGASGTANSWAEYAATHHHEATVIGNFEANPRLAPRLQSPTTVQYASKHRQQQPHQKGPLEPVPP